MWEVALVNQQEGSSIKLPILSDQVADIAIAILSNCHLTKAQIELLQGILAEYEVSDLDTLVEIELEYLDRRKELYKVK